MSTYIILYLLYRCVGIHLESFKNIFSSVFKSLLNSIAGGGYLYMGNRASRPMVPLKILTSTEPSVVSQGFSLIPAHLRDLRSYIVYIISGMLGKYHVNTVEIAIAA
jgi:hypothetical protein